MNSFPLTEALVRVHLAERYDEVRYTRAAKRQRRRRRNDLPDSPV
jgi:hypothetical protein